MVTRQNETAGTKFYGSALSYQNCILGICVASCTDKAVDCHCHEENWRHTSAGVRVQIPLKHWICLNSPYLTEHTLRLSTSPGNYVHRFKKLKEKLTVPVLVLVRHANSVGMQQTTCNCLALPFTKCNATHVFPWYHSCVVPERHRLRKRNIRTALITTQHSQFQMYDRRPKSLPRISVLAYTILFGAYLPTLSVARKTWRSLGKLLLNNTFQNMWREVIVVWLQALPRHSPRRNEETHRYLSHVNRS